MNGMPVALKRLAVGTLMGIGYLLVPVLVIAEKVLPAPKPYDHDCGTALPKGYNANY